MKHVIQRGGPADPVIIFYFIHPDRFPDIRDALGPACTIVAFDKLPGETPSQILIQLRAVEWKDQRTPSGPVVLVGYSAGCQEVRSAIRRGRDGRDVMPDAVVAIDGAHASMPPEDWQIKVWKDLAEDARAGKRLFVATCTQNTYVEHLEKGPYLSTLSVLERVTGWELRLSRWPGARFKSEQEGRLLVESYPSTDCDHDAHVDQQVRVLPEMLRRYVAPWLEEQRASADASEGLDEEVRAQASAAVATSLDALARGLDHGPKGDA